MNVRIANKSGATKIRIAKTIFMQTRRNNLRGEIRIVTCIDKKRVSSTENRWEYISANCERDENMKVRIAETKKVQYAENILNGNIWIVNQWNYFDTNNNNKYQKFK